MYKSEDQILEHCLRVIEEDKQHKLYDHCVQHAEWCNMVMTGDEQDDVLISYKTTESETQRERRIRLYNSKTQYLGNKVMSVFKEVDRAEASLSITFNNNKENSKDLLKRQLAVFQGNGLKKYLLEAYKHFNFYDPNAFLLINYDNEEQKPYAVEIYSDQVIDFNYHFESLEFLLSRTKVEGDRDEKFNYYLYGIGYAYEFLYIDEDNPAEDGAEVISIGKDTFALIRTETGLDQVPAIQMGYHKDPRTNRESYVSPLYPAEKQIKSLIINTSEYDLAKALHGFLQKFTYAPVCEFEGRHDGMVDSCINGVLSVSGHQCPACKGTGIQNHTTVQDIRVIAMPKSADDIPVPLSNMVHYVNIPDNLFTIWKEDIKDIIQEAGSTIFHSDIFSKDVNYKTATESLVNLRSVYNVLADYAAKLSTVFEFSAERIGDYTGAAGAMVRYKFPQDFRMESLEDLLEMRAKAISSSAPAEVLEEIDNKILKIQYADNPTAILKIQTKAKLKPFGSHSMANQSLIIAGLPIDNDYRVLWTYFDEIMRELERENYGGGLMFYELPYERQEEEVMNKVTAFKERLQIVGNQPLSLPNPLNES